MNTGNRVDGVAPDAPDLAGPGPSAVGVTTLLLVRPDAVDLGATGDGPVRRRDRRLVCEVWYPAGAETVPGCAYDTVLRDGVTPVQLFGRASRAATPAAGRFPLVLLSHGFPGNRMLMAHLGEALASRGFVVAALDHPESTYDDLGAFGSTLLHRPYDQRFALDALADGPLGPHIEGGPAAVIGYSMGAYGALTLAGAGLSAAALAWPGGARADLLAFHAASSRDPAGLGGDRLGAVVLIGLWGAQHGFWDEVSLAGVTRPLLFIGGDRDTISGYDTGIRRAFAAASGAHRHLLTLVGAGHNAGAPIPAPAEAQVWSPRLDFRPAEHYADPVWDSVRMNGIAQHVIAAFLGRILQGRDNWARYLDPAPDNTPAYGFTPGAAAGLRLESLGEQSISPTPSSLQRR